MDLDTMAEPVLPPGAREAERYDLATPAGEAAGPLAAEPAEGAESKPIEEPEPTREQISAALQ
eukprot:4905628-Alexandrium_andersonii.AAC.1